MKTTIKRNRKHSKYTAYGATAIVWLGGTEIKRLIQNSKSIFFSKRAFYRNCTWHNVVDTKDTDLEGLDNNLKRAIRISKILELGIVFKNKYEPISINCNGYSSYLKSVWTEKPNITYFQDKNTFQVSIPLIQGEKRNDSGSSENTILRKSCWCNCLVCQEKKMHYTYDSNKNGSIVKLFNDYGSTQYINDDFLKGRFEYVCDKHIMKFLGITNIEQKEYFYSFNENKTIDFIKFISSEKEIYEKLQNAKIEKQIKKFNKSKAT